MNRLFNQGYFLLIFVCCYEGRSFLEYLRRTRIVGNGYRANDSLIRQKPTQSMVSFLIASKNDILSTMFPGKSQDPVGNFPVEALDLLI